MIQNKTIIKTPQLDIIGVKKQLIMNIFKFYLFIFFFSSITQGQTKSIITYDVFSTFMNIEKAVKDKIKDKKILSQLNKTFNSDDRLACILIIDKGKSFFFKLDKMRVDKKSIVDVLIGDGLFYSNIKDSYLIEEKVTFDKKFLIKHEKINWILINEEKKIGDYLCKKATAKKTVVNSAGEFTTDLIAWYAPSIPLNFGPKNFNGLPGLILELTDRQMVYKVSKLELNSISKKYKVKIPKKGKLLTYEEYEKELKNLFNKYRN
tara:strand:+ start:266 stop:1054 length:789 start_codon:yes stop_codon:yes gene_type:complete